MTKPFPGPGPAQGAVATGTPLTNDTAPDEITAMAFMVMKLAGASAAHRQAKRYGTMRVFVWSAVVLFLILLVFLAYEAEDHTFQQLLLVTLFGGVAAFAMAPIFLRLTSKWVVLFPLVAALGATGLGYAAYAAHGLWRHLLLELSVAVALLLGLDQLLKGAIRRLDSKQRDFSEATKKWMALEWSDMLKALRK